jgi:hypothetical protein
MTDILKNGLTFLETKLLAHASSPVEYRQGGLIDNAITVNATFGKTDIQIGETDGFKVQSFVWDFLIQADTLGFLPEVGDCIIADGQTYEVMTLPGQGCWRFTSHTRKVYRIHTRGPL